MNTIKSITDKLSETLQKKAADYSKTADPTENFKTIGEILDISPEKVVLVFALTKILRIQSLQGRKENFEALSDSWMDLANYGIIGSMISEKKTTRQEARKKMDEFGMSFPEYKRMVFDKLQITLNEKDPLVEDIVLLAYTFESKNISREKAMDFLQKIAQDDKINYTHQARLYSYVKDILTP
jgi:hypothetical protein